MALVVRKIGNPNTDCNAHYSFSDLSNYNWLTDRVKELFKHIEAESLLALTLTKIYSHLWFKLFFHDCVRSGDWHLALSKTKKQTDGASRLCKHCTLCGCCGKNNKSMLPTVSQIMTKTKTFLLEPKHDLCKLWVLYN